MSNSHHQRLQEPSFDVATKLLRAALLAIVVTAAAVMSARAADWNWQLPAARYQKLNQFERAQYDKAAAMVEKKNFKMAAEEFEKFKIEFPDSPLLSYALLMRGYCLQQSNNRITAIKIHQEVLDYFPENAGDCAAALYFVGLAHLDNGDTFKGLKALQTLADDPRYRDWPLTAGAIRRLGDDSWAKKQYDDALTRWKQVVSRYGGQNDEEVRIARENAASAYVKNRDYAGFEAWLVNDQNRSDPKARKWIVETAYDRAWHGFRTDWEKYAAASEKERIEKNKLKAQDMQAFYEYLKANRAWFEKANDLWGYHERAMGFLTELWGDRLSREAETEDALAMIKTVKDKTDADNKLARLVDFLKNQGQYARGRTVLALMQDKTHACYKDYELFAHEHKWPQAIARLEEVEQRGDAAWKDRAMMERAGVYKDGTGQYEKAIKLYQAIGKPPGTLWSIQEAYHRWGKLKESLATLSEIEAMFPDDASRAAWQKASYLIEAGDKKGAIAQARRIMKKYPKSQDSASAHRWLEDNGVPSGGGVSDE